MNFNDAAELAMWDTVQRAIYYEAYQAVDMAISGATRRTYGATYGPTNRATYRAIAAQFEVLRETRDEL